MSKIEKTIARQQEKYLSPTILSPYHQSKPTNLPHRISSGQFYEAHQQLRVIGARYIKASNWDAAVELLHGGALALLQAGQGGSGGDLCLMLLDVYSKGEIGVTAESKGKLLTLLRAFPPDEPTRKRFVGEMVGWTTRFGEYANGDPEVHHVAGTLFAESMLVLCAVYQVPRRSKSSYCY